MHVYVDASALVKLGIDEPESRAMKAALEGADVFMSIIGRVEVERVLRRRLQPDDAHVMTLRILHDIHLVDLDVATCASASIVQPSNARTLDAIHLATAQALLPDLDECYCYDERLALAMREAGLVVRAPQ